MIKFFRKIRYNLMSENKTGSSAETSVKAGKYLKYAIGEILLVVLGILIALQINNWNQERINKARSIGYMKSLVEDIKSDIVQYNINIESYTTDINNNKRLFINDDYKMLNADSIIKLVSGFYMINKTTRQTYEKIKNAGLVETLGTDATNKAVNDYYSLENVYYENLLQWDKENMLKNTNFWFYNNNYESSSVRDYNTNALPFIDSAEKRKADLIKLIESTQGRNHLRGAIIRHEHTRKRVKEIMAYAEKLIELLNTELNSK